MPYSVWSDSGWIGTVTAGTSVEARLGAGSVVSLDGRRRLPVPSGLSGAIGVVLERAYVRLQSEWAVEGWANLSETDARWVVHGEICGYMHHWYPDGFLARFWPGYYCFGAVALEILELLEAAGGLVGRRLPAGGLSEATDDELVFVAQDTFGLDEYMGSQLHVWWRYG